VVAFSSGLDARTKKRGEDVVRSVLRGTIAPQGDEEGVSGPPDVLVMGPVFTKSLKTLLALARGTPVVAATWLDAVSAAGTWVDPSSHLLSDPAAERREKFTLRAAHARAAAAGPLLAGAAALIAPGALRGEKDGGGGLRRLLAAAGARVAETPGGLGQAGGGVSGSGSGAARALVIGTPEDKPWARRSLPRGAPVFCRDTFVAALLTQSLDWGRPLFAAGD
jgi:hypothetical protein